MTTITFATDYPGGAGAARRTVLLRLEGASAGGEGSGSEWIGGTARIDLDASGTASVDLTPNASITPSGTYYVATIVGASPAVTRGFTVPASGGPYSWADTDLEVELT